MTFVLILYIYIYIYDLMLHSVIYRNLIFVVTLVKHVRSLFNILSLCIVFVCLCDLFFGCLGLCIVRWGFV